MQDAPTHTRRYDLDWLRIGAFGLLIFYHVGMFYVTWGWHVKSSHAGHAIEPLMLFVNPWRLLLLFFISGVASRFMADKISAPAFAGKRLWRLLPPLLFAMFVIVAPQSYYQVVEALGSAGTVGDFYAKYVTGSGHWCDADGCLTTPTWNHMWFVAYLIVYTLILVPFMGLLRRAPKALGWLIAGPGFFLLPWLWLGTARAALSPMFADTHALTDDWYLHSVYLPMFVFGFAVAKHEPFFAACLRWRYLLLAGACGAYATLFWARLSYSESHMPPDWLMTVFRFVHEGQAWCAILALIGFGQRYLNGADGPVRRYLTDAVFPFYLLHQTIIVVAAYHLNRLGWPLWLEAPLLIGLTFAGCWAGYELARRSGPLRPLFGLAWKSTPRVGKTVETIPPPAHV